MTLDKILKGQRVQILKIPNPQIRVQAIRLGLCEGATLTCSEKLPSGPVVLQNKMQEIAIGHRLAATIEIKAV